MSSLKKLLEKKKYLKIKLRKIVTNHLELDAELNGVKGKFILDTAHAIRTNLIISRKFEPEN